MLSKRIISCLDVRDGKLAKSVKFVEPRDLAQSAELTASTAQYHFQNSRGVERSDSTNAAQHTLLDAQLEIALDFTPDDRVFLLVKSNPTRPRRLQATPIKTLRG